MEATTTVDLSRATQYYLKHSRSVQEYQKRNKDKMKTYCKNYWERIKEDRPELHQEILRKKKEYYHNVVKPKRIAREREKLTSEQLID